MLAVMLAGAGLNLAVIHPLHNYLLDFRAYYASGWALLHQLNPYDIDAINRYLELPGGQPTGYCGYPPPDLLVFVPFSRLPFPLAQVPWCVLQFGLGAASLMLLFKLTGVGSGSPAAVLIGFAFLTSGSVFELFRWGQFDLIVLALLSLALIRSARGQPVAAGIFIGLATVAKVTPGVYLGIFALRRDWKGLASALVTILVLMLASFPLVGLEGVRSFYGLLTAKLGQVPHLISPDNMSLTGYVYRALVDHRGEAGTSLAWLNLGPTVAHTLARSAVALVVLVTAIWLVRHRKTLETHECIAGTVPVVLLISPITWTHHGVILLIPFVLAVAAVARRPRPGGLDLGCLALIALSWTFRPVQQFQLNLPSQLHHLFAPLFTYAVVAMWLFMLIRYVPLRRAAQSESRIHAEAAPSPGRP